MRRFIFGCILMICGMIGGTGWLIAYAIIAGTGAMPSLTVLFSLIDYGIIEGYIVSAFYIIAVVGAVLAVLNLRDEGKSSK